MPDAPKVLPKISHQTANVLNNSDIMPFMPRADFFLWFTPVVSRLAILAVVAPVLPYLLGQIGILQSVIFPITIFYMNSLRPFLQWGFSGDIAPLMSGVVVAIYSGFLVAGVGVAIFTLRILNHANAMCLTERGISLGTSSQVEKERVIYQERKELEFKDVTSVQITRPKTTRSNLDYEFIFNRGMESPFKIRYGDILKNPDREKFVAIIKHQFADQIDDEALEPFAVAGEKQSYTELWLKELSASPKRDKLTPLELGATLHNGRYHILAKIGVGGQGTVYLAQDMGSKTKSGSDPLLEVVLKEFLLPVFPDTRVRKAAAIKFQEEADLLGKLEHPQIVKFHELFLEDHRAYLVLEKLEGVTLKDYVDSKGSLAPGMIEELAGQMCQILKYLHNQTPPVVHRDFTPDNLILGEDGKIKLLDFSVAQSVTSNVTGSVVGKPHYIAPEQFRGKATSQSDIYSLGATLYYLITGMQPEPITNLKLDANLESKSKAYGDARVEVNGNRANSKARAKLARIIEKATKLDVSNRYQKVEEILQDLA